MDALVLIALVFALMSLPLAVILYQRFAKSKYGSIIWGVVVFILLFSLYLALKILKPEFSGVPLAEACELLASLTMLYTAVLMFRTFAPGGA